MNASQLTRALLLSTLFSTAAHAYDGTITFTGALTSNTCELSSSSQTVPLPTLAATALKSAGSWAGRTPFTVSLTGCNDGATSVGLYFEQTDDIDTSNGTLNNIAAVSPATNVQVQLLNANFVALDLSKGSKSAQNSLSVDASSGTAAIQLYAQYFSENGSATAGSVEAQAIFSLDYL
ncbi:MAG: type 1 fimbrial protein [Aeromonadaceae bacterium]|nr:type 1 fimbrial protein [Aeromonadaceae bacterium]